MYPLAPVTSTSRWPSLPLLSPAVMAMASHQDSILRDRPELVVRRSSSGSAQTAHALWCGPFSQRVRLDFGSKTATRNRRRSHAFSGTPCGQAGRIETRQLARFKLVGTPRLELGTSCV